MLEHSCQTPGLKLTTCQSGYRAKQPPCVYRRRVQIGLQGELLCYCPCSSGVGERPPREGTTRQASICHLLGGEDSELNCLSLLTADGSCRYILAQGFTAGSPLPSLILPSDLWAQPYETPFPLHSTVSLTDNFIFIPGDLKGGLQ